MQLHLLRLAIWTAASVLAGTTTLAWLAAARKEALHLRAFGWGLASVGAAVLALWIGEAALARPMDYAGALALAARTRATAAVGGAVVLAGVTVLLRARARPAALGWGAAMVVHGAAIALLHALFLPRIAP